MPNTSVVYEIYARDMASKAFRDVAASAKEQQVAVTKAFSEQDAVARRAKSGLIASLKSQENELKRAAAQAEKYGKSTAFLNSHKEQLDKVASGLAGIGAAAAGGFGVAVKQSMDYNDAMARVGAFSDDARAHMDQLRQLSMKVGVSIGFSATQSAQAMEEMVKAGVSSTNMINGGLKGALQLAAAGQIDVSQATEIAAAAMTQFGLSGSKIPHVADLLAAGADKALGGVGDLGEAMKYAGTQSKQYGVSIEDTVGVLADFAQHGQLGEMAGAQFAQMLSRLGAPTKKAAAEMKSLGLNVYDSNGNFVNMTTLAGRLQKAFEKLTPAQRNAAEQTIFGQRAMRGANILVQDGAKGIQDWINKVNDQGFAAQTASRKMDSLRGDLRKLKAAFDNALIGAGQGSQGPLRQAVQELTKWIDAWDSLAPAAQHAITDIVGGIAVLGLGGAATIKVVTGIAAMKKSLIDLGITGRASGEAIAAGAELGETGMGKLRKAAGITAGAIAAIAIGSQVFDAFNKDFNPTVEGASGLLAKLSDNAKGAGTDLNKAFTFSEGDLIKNKITGIGQALDAYSNKSYQLDKTVSGLFGSSSLLGNVDKEFNALDQSLANMANNGSLTVAQKSFGQLAAQAQKSGHSITDLLPHFQNYENVLQQQASSLHVYNLSAKDYAEWMGGKIPAAIKQAEAAQKGQTSATVAGTGATQTWSGAMKAATDKAKAQSKALQQQRADMLASANAALTASGDQIAFKQSIADATSAADKNKHTLDLNTQAGRDNRTALNNLASSTLTYVQDLIKNKASTDKLRSATEQGRQSFIKVAEQMGATKSQAKKLADQYGLIPKQVATHVSAPGAQTVMDQLDRVTAKINDVHGKTVTVRYNVLTNTATASYSGGNRTASSKATGGPISGPGSGTSDSVPIMASNGEYVIKASSANKLGAGRLNYINATGQLPAFATGGSVNIRNLLSGGGASALASGISSVEAAILKAASANAKRSFPSMSGLSGGTSGANEKLGMAMMMAAGWPSSQWPALKALWTRESGWNANAVNSSSGAYGIPQALGHGHPFALGDARSQIAWGLNYIRGRYGSPAAAWGHETAAGWYAKGGMVRGPGTGTSDSVPAMLSAGEVVIPADVVQHFASGGPVSSSAFGSSSLFSVASIVALIRAISQPMKSLTNLTSAMRSAQAAAQRASHVASVAHRPFAAASSAYSRAVNSRDNLRATNARQLKNARDLVATREHEIVVDKKDHASKAALAKAEDRLTAARAKESKVSRDNTAQIAVANAKVSSTSKAKTAAQNAYNKALATAKTKSDAYKAAQANLVQEQQAVADSAKQVSDSLSSQFNAPTGSIMDLFTSMNKGAANISIFGQDIDKLRKKGLSESIIDQIISQAQSGGVASGISLAGQALTGGSYLIGLLNKSAQQLTDAANIFGYHTATAKGTGYASGTNWATPGIHAVAENGIEVVVGRQARRFAGGEIVKPVSGYKPDNNMRPFPVQAEPSELHVHFHGVTDTHAAANEITQVLRKDTRYRGGVKMGLRTRQES